MSSIWAAFPRSFRRAFGSAMPSPRRRFCANWSSANRPPTSYAATCRSMWSTRFAARTEFAEPPRIDPAELRPKAGPDAGRDGRAFPKEATWTRPDGGLFVWVSLPEGSPPHSLLERAAVQDKGRLFRARPFFPDGSRGQHDAPQLSNATFEQIDTIDRLGRVIHEPRNLERPIASDLLYQGL